MRLFYLILSSVFFCGFLHAQAVKINYEGDPLTKKERQKIEETIYHEVSFYTQFGLPDTLNLVLHVFDKQTEALYYLQQLDIHVDRYTGGLYVPRLGKAFILGREKNKSLGIVFHELSHHFTLLITSNRPPAWLAEGLAEYFEHCKVGKKGLQHTFTEYEQGRIRTMYMLGEVDLPTFINSKQDKFMKQQKTDEQYAYILAHALVTFWIEKVPRQILKNFITTLQDKKDFSAPSARIERIYPGGFSQFEQDFAAFCK